MNLPLTRVGITCLSRQIDRPPVPAAVQKLSVAWGDPDGEQRVPNCQGQKEGEHVVLTPHAQAQHLTTLALLGVRSSVRLNWPLHTSPPAIYKGRLVGTRDLRALVPPGTRSQTLSGVNG